MNAKELNELADTLFEKKARLNSLHQEIAEHFYPERADFALRRDVGDEFADHLMTSYPVLTRRELADNVGTMLRPSGQPWFKMVPDDPEREDHDAKAWLEAATRIQRRAMYDPAAMLQRAAKEADNDFATFGQTAISAEIVWDDEANGPHLLHRCWHLRDMAWQEDRFGKIGNRFRRWKVSARDLSMLFPGRVHSSVARLASMPGRKPFTEVECVHMIVERDLYDADKRATKRPWWSIYWDQTNRHLVEAEPVWSPYYAIPRWQTVSGSQYAHSPATIVGLPDARLIQAMTRTLLEVGEKIANPPMVATDEVVRSDVQIFPGGITWVDRDYDERLGEALRPITLDSRGVPIGIDMQRDARQLLWQAFYLNKLVLPQRAPEMTAYEISQRVQEYIRGALPLFEPMEADYNGQLCEMDFDLLLRAGAFGSPRQMPPSLQGARVSFQFMSPLHDAIEAQKTNKFLEAQALIAQAVTLDPTAPAMLDVSAALRDAMSGAGIPTKWLRSEAEVAEAQGAAQAEAQAAKLLEGLKAGGDAAQSIAGAATEMESAAPALPPA